MNTNFPSHPFNPLYYHYTLEKNDQSTHLDTFIIIGNKMHILNKSKVKYSEEWLKNEIESKGLGWVRKDGWFPDINASIKIFSVFIGIVLIFSIIGYLNWLFNKR